MAYTWPDGSKNHTISWSQHQANQQTSSGTPLGYWGGSPGAANAQAPAAAAPAPAPAPAAVAPQPYDPAYQGSVLTAGRNVALGNNEAAWQTQNTGYNTGYNADGTVNTANPYSEAQKLQDSYHNTQRGTLNSMAAGGQLYSGANLNAQAINDNAYAQSDAALKQNAQQQYHTIGANQLSNYATNAIGVSDASFNSLQHTVYGS